MREWMIWFEGEDFDEFVLIAADSVEKAIERFRKKNGATPRITMIEEATGVDSE